MTGLCHNVHESIGVRAAGNVFSCATNKRLKFLDLLRNLLLLSFVSGIFLFQFLRLHAQVGNLRLDLSCLMLLKEGLSLDLSQQVHVEQLRFATFLFNIGVFTGLFLMLLGHQSRPFSSSLLRLVTVQFFVLERDSHIIYYIQ